MYTKPRFKENVKEVWAMKWWFNWIIKSPEPKAHWWAYRIGRPPSSVHRPSVVCPLFTHFKHLLLRNHWADWSQISYGVSMGWVNKSLFTSRKILRIKVTPDLHLTCSKNGGNLGLVLKMKNIACISILLTNNVKYIYLYLFKLVLYSILAFKAN